MDSYGKHILVVEDAEEIGQLMSLELAAVSLKLYPAYCAAR